ncbi:unnamed protein product [Discula destructiva]
MEDAPSPDRTSVDKREASAPLDEVVEDSKQTARPRKRTRRACDKCSTSRTRCNGEHPCRRCKEYGYTCCYNREIKKRGRAATAPRARQGSLNGRYLDAVSPSSPLTSPENSVQPAQFRRPDERHRSSFASSQDDGRPSLSHIITQNSPSVGPPSTYAVSPVYSSAQSQMHLSSLLQSTVETPVMPPAAAAAATSAAHGSPPQLSSTTAAPRTDTLPSDDGMSYVHSPADLPPQPPRSVRGHESFSYPGPTSSRYRGSCSTSTPRDDAVPETQRAQISLYKAPSADCRYRCLDPVLPYLQDIIPASVACDLLDVYLTEPGSSLFRCASPYIITRVFRKKSLLHPTHPRLTTPALLATMLWCSAQTADIVLLHVPGSRARICNALYDLATALISDRDPDRWRRIHGGLKVETDQPQNGFEFSSTQPLLTARNEPAGVIDDVLTFILLSIAVSGGDFKSDCFKWWSKAVRLALSLELNREDERCSAVVSPCANPLCSCKREQETFSFSTTEAREERRRVFWLLYCLDRHLALSFNRVLDIPDAYCEIYAPLPEAVWESLDTMTPRDLPERTLGPPTVVTGTGFFEYFLPLMAILGDIIIVHHRRFHPRLGLVDDAHAVAIISDQLASCEASIDRLRRDIDGSSPLLIRDLVSGGGGDSGRPQHHHHQQQQQQQQQSNNALPSCKRTRDRSRLQLVTAYSTHILHVLHVLLYGKWDAISMLDDDDDWITSRRFNECASHAIAASQAVSSILKFDPELTFMPYLFGIYLLHGSFILLLFADRMPQLGANQSVELACETIVRAHEVCVVTLSTEFQKNFRKVLRSTLYSVRGSSPTEWEEHKARRRALSLYRWTKGAKGLAL